MEREPQWAVRMLNSCMAKGRTAASDAKMEKPNHAVFQAALCHDGSLVAHALTIQIYNLYSDYLLF